jgi:hypothetical protein
MAGLHGSRRGSIVRPNAHDWKSCEGNTSAGSNPALSASAGNAPQVACPLWRFRLSIHITRCHPGPAAPSLGPRIQDANQRRASWNRAHRHGCTRALPAPPPAMPFCRPPTHVGPMPIQRLRDCQRQPHTRCPVSGNQHPERPLQTGAPEARFTYRSACRETKHSPSCRTRSSANKNRVSLSK